MRRELKMLHPTQISPGGSCFQCLVEVGDNLKKFSSRILLGSVVTPFVLLFTSTASAQVDHTGLVVPSQPGLGVFNEGYSPPAATVDPSKGVAHAEVPFALLPARGAPQPILSLVYSSDAGTRTAGVGWGLDLPAIERKALSNPGTNLGDRYTFAGQPIVPICQTGALVTSPGPVTLCESILNEHIPLWAPGWTYYRMQVEGSFARIFRSPAGSTWRVELKSGVTMEFGAPLIAPGAGSQAIDGPGADFFNPDRRVRWNLVRQFDTQGTLNTSGTIGSPVNVVVYQWQSLGALGLGYLVDIYDTSVAGADLDQVATYAHHTHLVYEPHDFPNVSHAQVWHATPDLRLKRVDVASKNFAGTGPRELVRRYHMTYKTILHGSYLQSVQLEGRCPATESSQGILPDVSNCPTMPPITFKYAERDMTGYLFNSVDSPQGAPHPETPFDYLLTATVMDIDGDGLPDVVQGFRSDPLGDRSFSFYMNRGTPLITKLSYTAVDAGNLFSKMYGLPGSDNIFLNALNGISVMGYWGNVSRSSVLWRGHANSNPHGQDGYILTYPMNYENPPGHDNWKWIVGNDLTGPKVYLLADIDGDGLQDAVGTDNKVYYTAKDLSSTAEFLHPFSASVTTNLLIADPNPNLPPHPSALVDMNGDGLPDYVTTINPGTANEQYVYYPGDGTGKFACVRPQTACVTPTGAPAYMPIKTPKAAQDRHEALPPYSPPSNFFNMYFHDISGDGLADIVVFDSYTISIWLNDDGVNFHRIPLITLAPLQARNCGSAKLTFADFNASGTDAIVILCNGGLNYIGLGAPVLGTGTATPIRPGLLVEIANGLGVTTKIGYDSTAALDAGARSFSGIGHLPWHDHSRRVEYVVTSLETNTNLPSIGPPNINLPSLLDQHSLVNFTYTDPIFDEWQQAFLGFRKVGALRYGNQHEGSMYTETTYFFGPCQTPNSSNCPQTSDDDWWKAVTGVPVLAETFDFEAFGVPVGNRLSTTVWEYRSQALFTGIAGDTRRVRFAYPERTDTWLYDESTGNVNSPIQTLTVPVVHYLVPDYSDQIEIALASAPGRVHLRAEETRDSWGNVTQTINHGQINDDGTPVDLPIITNIQPVTPALYWRWTIGSVTIQPFPDQRGVPNGAPRALQFQYDSNGNLIDVFAQLTGSQSLDRFHEDPTKAVANPPLTASVDNPKLQLRHWIYDQWGNATQVEGPQNGGGCTSFTYETTFQQLATDSVIFTEGCSDHHGQGLPLKTHLDYDRGLDVIVASNAPTGAQSKTTYDGFGRINEAYEPDPVTGSVSDQPSVKAEYFVTAGGPAQLVHTQTIDSQNTYRSVWTYFNGLGTPILVLREADPAAGDGGQWVASGLPFRGDPGSPGGQTISQTFRPWFYNGDPRQYVIGGGADGDPLYEFHNDSHGRILRVDDSSGPLLRYAYHALSQDNFDAADLEPNGSHSNTPSSIQRDGHGRVVALTRELKTSAGLDKITTQWIYLSTGEVAGQFLTHSLGNEQVSRWMQYDSLGRIVLNVEPNTSYTQLIRACPPTTLLKNLPLNRPTCIPETKLRAWRYAYNDAGRVVGTSDARGCGKNLFYDRIGRLLAEDFSPCRSYHPDYTLPNLSDGSGTETLLHYDAPEPGQNGDFGSNPAFLVGNLAATSSLGEHTRLAWDARGRLVGLARQLAKPGMPDPSPSTRYASWWFRNATAFDVADRVTSQSTGADIPELMVQAANQIVYESNLNLRYTTRGLVGSVGSSYGDLVTDLKYDSDGALLHQVYGDTAATVADLSYNDRRNMKEFKLWRLAPGLWSHPIGGYVPPTGTDPSTLQLTLEDLVFAYDAADNPINISDKRDQAEWPAGAKPVSRTMTYDDLFRVTQVGYDSAGDQQLPPFAAENSNGDMSPVPTQQLSSRVQQQSFSYDYLGNTKQTTDDANAFYDRSLGTITNGASQQWPNQILSALSNSGEILTAHYDGAGDLEDLAIVRKGACASPAGKCTQRFVYDWDEVGRLSRVRRWDYTLIPPNEPVYPSLPNRAADADLQYKHDADGIRVLKSKTDLSGNQLHSAEIFGSLRLNHATWDPISNNYERTPLTEAVYLGRLARVIYAQQPLPTVNNTQQHVLFLIGDPSKSMSAVVDKTTGEVVERTTYDAFGSPDSDYRPQRWSSFREDYRFTGKEDDIEAGLLYFGARYYQPSLGRWINPDPLTIHGLGSDPNPYGFVHGSPLRFVDVIGLDDGACLGREDCGGPATGFSPDPVTIIGPPYDPNPTGGSGPSGAPLPSPYRAPPPPPQTAASATGVLGGAGISTGGSGQSAEADVRAAFRRLSQGRDIVTGATLGGGLATEISIAVKAVQTSVNLSRLVTAARALSASGAITALAAEEESLASRASELMGAAWEEFGSSAPGLAATSRLAGQVPTINLEAAEVARRVVSISVTAAETESGVLRLISTNNQRIADLLASGQINLQSNEIVLNVVRDPGGNIVHSERAAIEFLIRNGISSGTTLSFPLGCITCQEWIYRFAPGFVHLTPAPGGGLAPP
jgi:RHS repeat-associated protein